LKIIHFFQLRSTLTRGEPKAQLYTRTELEQNQYYLSEK
jgi:hypothetical protein